MVNETKDSEVSALEKLFTESSTKTESVKSANTLNQPVNSLDQTNKISKDSVSVNKTKTVFPYLLLLTPMKKKIWIKKNN